MSRAARLRSTNPQFAATLPQCSQSVSCRPSGAAASGHRGAVAVKQTRLQCRPALPVCAVATCPGDHERASAAGARTGQLQAQVDITVPLATLSQLAAIDDAELQEAVSAALLQLLHGKHIRTDQYGSIWRLVQSACDDAMLKSVRRRHGSVDALCAHLEQILC